MIRILIHESGYVKDKKFMLHLIKIMFNSLSFSRSTCDHCSGLTFSAPYCLQMNKHDVTIRVVLLM